MPQQDRLARRRSLRFFETKERGLPEREWRILMDASVGNDPLADGSSQQDALASFHG